jgi:hypothetical protein
MIDGADQGGDAGVGHAHVFQKLGGFLGRELAEFLLDAGGDDDRFRAAVFGGELADLGDLRMESGFSMAAASSSFGTLQA